MDSEIARIYGDRVRVRVCGLLFQGDSVLMVNHRHVQSNDFWAPPGGGIEFNESMDLALKRELKEECGLDIKVLDFAFGCEFIQEPLHAIELFFWIETTGGKLQTGSDPELQIIEETRYLSPAEIDRLPHEQLHGIFKHATTKTQFLQLKGFYRI